MIRQITEKSIGHRVSIHIFYSSVRWLFFEIDKIDQNKGSLGECLEGFKREKILPHGVYDIETQVENKIFQILYNTNEITEEEVIKFAHSLEL